MLEMDNRRTTDITLLLYGKIFSHRAVTGQLHKIFSNWLHRFLRKIKGKILTCNIKHQFMATFWRLFWGGALSSDNSTKLGAGN